MRALMRTIIVFSMLNSVATSFAIVEKAEVEADLAGVKADVSAARELVAESLTNVEPEIEQITKSIVLATTSQYSGAGRVLVIPTEETRVQDIVTIMEDMNVMVRILDKKLGEVRMISGFSIGGYRGGYGGYGRGGYGYGGHGGGQTQGILVDGYGALFLMKVNFSLSPPAETQQEKTEEPTDRLWEETRREIYELGSGKTLLHHERRVHSNEEYDPEKVEELKRILIKTFKHAANIRNLEPDKWIIVTVIGSGEPSGLIAGVFQSRSEVIVKSKDTKTVRVLAGPSPGEGGFSSPTVLTIRVEKSDVDDFAEGNMDFDEFREKVQIFTY